MVYRFDQFEVDDREFRFSEGGAPLQVEPKVLRLLIYLIANRNRLVRKQELLDAVWPDAIVTENALTRAIGLLRKALNEDSRVPRYIETVPTAGYRFIAKVAVVENVAVAPVSGTAGNGANVESAPPVEPAASKSVVPRRWWRGAVMAVAVTALVVAGLWRQRVPKPIESLAVLPLENLSHDPAQEYFAEGYD